jgi:hypothetical protein
LKDALVPNTETPSIADPEDLARARALAASLDCFLEDDLALLSDAKSSTVEHWRKHRKGPAHIRFGNRVLYPRAAVAQHLAELAADRGRAPALKAKDLL